MVAITKNKMKFKILTTFLLAFALILSPVSTLINNISAVVYAESAITTEVDGDTIELIGFKNEVEFNEQYKLPKVQEGNDILDYGDLISDARYSYKVFQTVPAIEIKNTDSEEEGKKVKGIHKNTDGEWVFYALTTSSYTLEITKKDGDKVITAIQNQSLKNKQSNGLTVNVKAQTYSIVLPTNSEHVVPEKMPLLSGDNKLELSIPRPTILSKTGEEISEAAYQDLEVRIRKGTEINQVLEAEDDGTYKYTPTQLGNYQIAYYYKVSGLILANRHQEFKVVTADSFKLDKLQLKVEFTGSIEERITLGLPQTLPGAYAVNQDGEKINAHIKITAKHVSANNDSTDCTSEINQKDFTITPTKLGNYWIYYQAVHPLFDIESAKTQPKNNNNAEHRIEVVDANTFDILLVNDYDIDAETQKITKVGEESVIGKTEEQILELLGNRSALVPSLVIIPENEDHLVIENVFPAIYAKDNFTTGYENFEFTRTVRDGSTNRDLYVLDGNGEATDEIYENYQSASFKFLKPTGTTRRYTVTYTATDKTNQLTVTRTFYINVLTEEDYTRDYVYNPTLEFAVDKDEVYADGVLTFEKPIVKDENVDYKDTNINVDIAVRVVGDTVKIITGAELEAMFNEETNQYEINFSTLNLGTITSAKVTAYARNDYYNQIIFKNFDVLENMPADSDLLPVHVEQEISVLSTVDKDAPKFAFKEDSLGAALYLANIEQILINYPSLTDDMLWNYLDTGLINIDGQDDFIFFPRDIITLPTVIITDADKNMKYSIHIFNNGNRVYQDIANPTSAIEQIGSEYHLTISGAQFEASLSGLYEVIYQIEDGLGNITTKTFGIRVGKSSEPAMVNNTFPTTAELGKEFVYPKITLSNGNVIESYERDVVVRAPDGYVVSNAGATSFTPNVEGEYKISYKWGDGENENTFFILNVTDTIAPVISTFYQYGYFAEREFSHIVEWKEEDKDKTLKIYLPMYTVTDESNNLESEIAKVTVRNKGNSIINTTANTEEGYHYFELKDYNRNQGVYTVEYTAVDRADNQAIQSSEHIITLRVGNSHDPEVTWAEEDAIPSKITLGEEWVLPIDKMIFNDLDEGDTHESLLELFKTKDGTVKLIAPNGDIVENKYRDSEAGHWGWVFDQVGEYRLSIVAYDNANNTWEKSYTITVSSEEISENINISNTVGTILIILSVAVLSGVVIYFLFSNKRLSKVEVKNQETKKQ